MISVLSRIPDYRIKALNVAVEMTFREYINIAKEIIDDNEFQRKKVISSRLKKTLKGDIKKKCTIPAIVLGVRDNEIPDGFDFVQFSDDEFLLRILNEHKVIILDGLQRTYVLLELIEEDALGDWLNTKIRCEVYLGVEKLGILYRMLTLNTGQTTMSTRHLLEILYFDYANITLENDIKLLLDRKEDIVENPLVEYKFKEIIEGYNSFINGREVPIERADILHNIETLDSLEKSDDEKDGFKKFLLLFHGILNKLNETSQFVYQEADISGTEFEITANPFGKSIPELFGKSQSLTGLGAALKFLKSNRELSLVDITGLVQKIKQTDPNSIYHLLKKFDHIRNKSKKVGNDQRFFFKIFYQHLFDTKENQEVDISSAIVKAGIRIDERLDE